MVEEELPFGPRTARDEKWYVYRLTNIGPGARDVWIGTLQALWLDDAG